MEYLHFTTRILGKEAAVRLKNKQVTQTLRSYNDNIVRAIYSSVAQLNHRTGITLDNDKIGVVQLESISMVMLDGLSIDDARRGGFDSISELALALRRAGYRFKPIEQYKFYRIQFGWL